MAKVVLGWPLLIAALTVMGLMLSKGKTPMEDSPLANRDAAAKAPVAGARIGRRPLPVGGSLGLRPPERAGSVSWRH